jgi:hypothetical protein
MLLILKHIFYSLKTPNPSYSPSRFPITIPFNPNHPSYRITPLPLILECFFFNPVFLLPFLLVLLYSIK